MNPTPPPCRLWSLLSLPGGFASSNRRMSSIVPVRGYVDAGHVHCSRLVAGMPGFNGMQPVLPGFLVRHEHQQTIANWLLPLQQTRRCVEKRTADRPRNGAVPHFSSLSNLHPTVSLHLLSELAARTTPLGRDLARCECTHFLC